MYNDTRPNILSLELQIKCCGASVSQHTYHILFVLQRGEGTRVWLHVVGSGYEVNLEKISVAVVVYTRRRELLDEVMEQESIIFTKWFSECGSPDQQHQHHRETC